MFGLMAELWPSFPEAGLMRKTTLWEGLCGCASWLRTRTIDVRRK
jgi:hypothetical protein